MSEYKRTLMGRILDWFCDHEHHDEEKELLRQEIRRIRLKTDIQEARIKKRLERKEVNQDFRPVGTYRLGMTYAGRKCEFIIKLSHNDTQRQVKGAQLLADDGKVIYNADMQHCWDLVSTQTIFTDLLEPWTHGVKTMNDLKLRAKWDTKLKVYV